MDVAILYSGGKDSTLCYEYAKKKGWNVKYFISVKPTRTDCFLFHYATVEHTKDLAKILKVNHVYATCEVADPKKEADIIKEIVKKNPVETILLGGVGLQETQIKSIRDAVFELGIEVFASHTGKNHAEMMYDMIERGYDIRICQVATEGLGKEWVGKKLTRESFQKLKELSDRYGFNIGGEGGYYDTFVCDGPIFSKRLEVLDFDVVMEDEYCGHMNVNSFQIIDKAPLLKDLY